jgi:predicted DsbA family dithiol-disulfide isomerase
LSAVDTKVTTERALTVFADYVCPFSYLSLLMLERASYDLGISVDWRAFELRPAPLPALEAATEGEWTAARKLAEAVGVTLDPPRHQPRTRKAHEATKFAAAAGMAPRLRRAIFDAHFTGNRDIGRIDILVEIAAGIGIDPLALKVALDVDVHTGEVVADGLLAQRLEIEGTPAFVAGNDVRVGYLSEDYLRDWLKD